MTTESYPNSLSEIERVQDWISLGLFIHYSQLSDGPWAVRVLECSFQNVSRCVFIQCVLRSRYVVHVQAANTHGASPVAKVGNFIPESGKAGNDRREFGAEGYQSFLPSTLWEDDLRLYRIR